MPRVRRGEAEAARDGVRRYLPSAHRGCCDAVPEFRRAGEGEGAVRVAGERARRGEAVPRVGAARKRRRGVLVQGCRKVRGHGGEGGMVWKIAR